MGISYEKSDVNSFLCMGVVVNEVFSVGASFNIYPLSVGTFDISGKIRLINKSMFGTAITMDYSNDNILSVNLIQRFELNGFILYLNGGLEGDSIDTKNFGISLQYGSLMKNKLNIGIKYFGIKGDNINPNAGIGCNYTFDNGISLYGAYKYCITDTKGLIMSGFVIDF